MITLTKNGAIYSDPGHTCENCGGIEEDVNKQVETVIPFLNNIINIEEDFTLEDFFKILKKDKEMIEVVFGSHMGHFSLLPYFSDIDKDCPIESREDIDYIELSWMAYKLDYKRFYEENKDSKNKDIIEDLEELSDLIDNNVKDISIDVDIKGMKEACDMGTKKCNKCDENMHAYIEKGLEFIPLYRLKHLPIVLNNNFMMMDKTNLDELNVIDGEKEFTVYDVFGKILSEISTYGYPVNRDSLWKKIVDNMSRDNK